MYIKLKLLDFYFLVDCFLVEINMLTFKNWNLTYNIMYA